MRAIVVDGGRVRLAEQPDPRPAAGEVLIRVMRAGICSTDLEIIKGYGRYSGILGHEFVGVVTAGSSKWVGKRVVGEINCVCGRCDLCLSGLASHCRMRTVVGIDRRPGVFAELVALPERNLVAVPDSVSDDEAVFAEPLAAALQILRQVRIEPRMSAAVIGTGRLGLLVAQVLAKTGCKLMAVGRNPLTLGWLDRKGIRTSQVSEIKQLGDCDLVVECTGSPEGFPLAMRMVRPRGTILMKTTCSAPASADLTALVVNEITLLGSRCGPMADAVAALARRETDAQGMITRQFPLAEAIAGFQAAADPGQIKVLLRIPE